MPEELWVAALDLAREWGPYQAAQLLGLSYSTVKHRFEAEEPGLTPVDSPGPSFVEVLSLAGPEALALPEEFLGPAVPVPGAPQ